MTASPLFGAVLAATLGFVFDNAETPVGYVVWGWLALGVVSKAMQYPVSPAPLVLLAVKSEDC